MKHEATLRAKIMHWLILVLFAVIISGVEIAESKMPLTREQVTTLIEKEIAVIQHGKDLAERIKTLEPLYWHLQSLPSSSLKEEPNRAMYLDKLYSLFEKEENSEIKFRLGFLLIRLSDQRPATYIVSEMAQGQCGDINPEMVSQEEVFLIMDHSQSLIDPCERIRYEMVLLLQDVRDRQDIQQVMRQVIQQDKSVWVRSAALGHFWNSGFRSAYLKELRNESDPQRQLQLIDDLMTVSKFMRSAGTEAAPLRFYPLQAHEINELRQMKDTTTNASLQAKLKTLLLSEADKTILFYTDPSPGQLNKPLILSTIRALLPEFNDSHIERLKVLVKQEGESRIQKILSSIIEDYHASTSSVPVQETGR